MSSLCLSQKDHAYSNERYVVATNLAVKEECVLNICKLCKTLKMLDHGPHGISVTKRQNGLSLPLAKMRYRALKFLVHFSTFLHTKMPQSQSKVVTQKGQKMETHFQALNEECGPFGGYFPAFFATGAYFEWPFFQFLLHLKNVKSGSHWKIMKLQWEPALTFCSLLLSAMKTCFSKSFTKCQNRLSLLLKSMKTWIDV